MLGAGGAARSIIGALLDAGVASIGVINRTEERVRKLRQDFGDRIRHLQSGEQDGALSACGLLVNTTSLGMHGQPPLELDVAILKDGCLVADIVYVPLQTRLIRDAEKRGLPVAGGLGMLLHQAVRGFELWYGVKPEVTAELRELVEADVRKAAGH
jgi:shikimate dehydrogenase